MTQSALATASRSIRSEGSLTFTPPPASVPSTSRFRCCTRRGVPTLQLSAHLQIPPPPSGMPWGEGWVLGRSHHEYARGTSLAVLVCCPGSTLGAVCGRHDRLRIRAMRRCTFGQSQFAVGGDPARAGVHRSRSRCLITVLATVVRYWWFRIGELSRRSARA